MLEKILNQLIIIAGQWRDKVGENDQFEQRFNQCLNQLQEITGKSREQAVQILLDHIEGGNQT